MSSRRSIPHILRSLATNLAIGLLLALMLLQSLPGVPFWLNWHVYDVANALGLAQGSWSMFAPNPDRTNHRVRATVTYADGQVVQWHSPDWAKQGLWERFARFRRMEYMDQIVQTDYAPALEDLADWVAREHAPQAGARPVRVEIWQDEAEIPDPRFHKWRPRAAPLPLDKHSLIFEKDYP